MLHNYLYGRYKHKHQDPAPATSSRKYIIHENVASTSKYRSDEKPQATHTSSRTLDKYHYAQKSENSRNGNCTQTFSGAKHTYILVEIT